MTPSFTRRHLVLGSAASVLYSASRAQGDPPWPARPVKVIVPRIEIMQIHKACIIDAG